MCSVRAGRVVRCVEAGRAARAVVGGAACSVRVHVVLWWGGRSVVWMSMMAVVVGVVGRWRVVVEWRGAVRDWRRASTTELLGLSGVVGKAARLCRGVGGLYEKGRLAAERVLCRLWRKCCREAIWDWCCRCSMTGLSRA